MFGAHFDGVVPESADYLLLVILQAVDTLAVLTVALYTRQSVVAVLPIGLHDLSTHHTEGERERGREGGRSYIICKYMYYTYTWYM